MLEWRRRSALVMTDNHQPCEPKMDRDEENGIRELSWTATEHQSATFEWSRTSNLTEK
jgi:hypothetical protein